MIRYALACSEGHAFESWFSNSDAFDQLKANGLLECPHCGDHDVIKQIMAPAVRDSGEKSGRAPRPAELAEMAAKVRAHIEQTHDYVGDRFADEARAMFYGDKAHRAVWGQVTPETARELKEEGVPAMPLPEPFAPEPPPPKDGLN